MNMKKPLLALFSLSAVLLPAISAIATPPPAVYKAADGEIVMHTGLSPSEQVDVEYPNIPATRKLKADYCGLVTIPNSDSQPIGSTVTIDGGSPISVSSLPIQTKPPCVNNTLQESRTSNFKLSNGSVIIVGKTPGISSTVSFDGSNTVRRVRANNCGFLTIRPTDALPIGTSIKLNGTTYTVSSLSTDKLPVCRSEDGMSVKYVPSTW